jgi:branched-chain amino acid transport system substrate-binding protein
VPTTRRRVLLGAGLAAAVGRAPLSRARAAAAPQPLPIGALFPFSGSLALLGDESFRGLDLATDDLNSGGGLLGRPVALVRGDANNGTQAAAEARRLVEKVKAGCIFGTYASGVAVAGSAVTELAGVPYFELDALADPVTERGLKLIFRSGPTATMCAVVSVDTVVDLLAPLWNATPSSLKVVALHEDGPTGTSLSAAQEKRCKERGFALAENIPYPGNTIDFAPLA